MATTATRAQLEAKRDHLRSKLEDPGIDLAIVAAELGRSMLADELELMKLLPDTPAKEKKIAAQLIKIAQAQYQIEKLQERKRDPRVLADIAAVEDQLDMLNEPRPRPQQRPAGRPARRRAGDSIVGPGTYMVLLLIVVIAFSIAVNV